MKIFINPGHSVAQGEDPGTCHFGLREADIALAIGQLVADYLTSAGCEVKVFQFDGLGEICDASNYWNADLFVSIHCNSATNPTACGTETFCVYGAGAGRHLAECVQSQIVNNLPVVDRHVQERGFAVLTGTTCPAILVETAFLSNKVDAELFGRGKTISPVPLLAASPIILSPFSRNPTSSTLKGARHVDS